MLAEGGDRALRYPPGIAPFGALEDNAPASFHALADLVLAGQQVALLSVEALPLPPGFELARSGILEQLVMTAPRDVPVNRTPAVTLGAADVAQMMELVGLTQPGPFSEATHTLGRYRGIRVDGQLVAMTGERLCLDGFTEVSAVCVHPAHQGHGHAAQLVQDISAAIRARGETPFLHAFNDNHAALGVYRKLGFTVRKSMCLTVLQRCQPM
jgi:predicted GNAT family acetyltransferase